MKLCKDCKHCPDGTLCNAPQNITYDPVTGRAIRVWDYCSTHRDCGFISSILPPGTCGKRGRWFEPKEVSNETQTR